MTLDITKVSLNDKATWDLICDGHTKGVFQLETFLGRRWCKKAQPKNIEELSDVISIIRPGCLKSVAKNGKSQTESYVDRKHGVETTESLYPPIDDVVKDTYNIIIYQEQSMKIAQKMAGFSESQADTLRKAMGKKRADLMKDVKDEFIRGCLKLKHKEEDASRIFDIIEKSNRYSFNKSHAVSYAFMAYWSAYLKANHPLKFYLNWLRNAKSKMDTDKEVYELIESAKADGFAFGVPSIMHISKDFEVEQDKIVFGLTNVKNVGVSEFEKIALATENNKEITSTWNKALILLLLGIDKRSAKSLILCGFCDCLDIPRPQAMHEFSCIKDLNKNEVGEFKSKFDYSISILENLKRLNKHKKEGGILFSKTRSGAINDIISRLSDPGRSLLNDPLKICIDEERLLGVPITFSKIDGCANASFADTTCKQISDGKKSKSIIAVEILEAKEFINKNGEKMCFVTAKDDSAKIDNVVIFSDVYEAHGDIIYESATVLLFGARSKDRDSFIVTQAIEI